MFDLGDIKSIIKSLVISWPGPMTVYNLTQDFLINEEYPLPYEYFGYDSAEVFLRSIPDTVQLEGQGRSAKVTITEAEKSSHICAFVKEQKNVPNVKKNSNVSSKRGLKKNYKSILKRIEAEPAPSWLKISSCQKSNNIKKDTDASIKSRKEPESESEHECLTLQTEVPELSNNCQKSQNDSQGRVAKEDGHSTNEGIMEDDGNAQQTLCQMNPEATTPCDNIGNMPKGNKSNLSELIEAIPLYAMNDAVRSLDFPMCSVKQGQKIPKKSLPDDFYVGAVINIFVTEVHSPFMFWFYAHSEERKEFNRLTDAMIRYYNNIDEREFCIPPALIKKGQICAALYVNTWHRAEVLQRVDSEYVNCYFIDFGTVSDVNIKSIKFLHEQFADIPCQAMRGCSSHIKPIGLRWTEKAIKFFESMALDGPLVGRISEIDRKNDVTYLKLYKKIGISYVQINQSLTFHGRAMINSDWDPENINKVGHRIRHPREDYPTFDMIEGGMF